MSAPDKIKDLVNRFQEQLEAYKSGKYNETQVRREFIDPFFKALGWDIDNEQGTAEAYKDVIHEDSIRVGGATKAPDYCFRIGGNRKFFLEAKKPIDILTEKLRRLRNRDYLPVKGVGSGRYGLTLEHCLSIPQNSSEEADFMGIELKTKHDKTFQTLFSRVLSRYLACKDKKKLVEKFGYFDEKRKRQALYASI